MHARWDAIHASSNCWFFSGPDGRDTQLVGDITFQRDNEHVTATFGGAIFTGTFREQTLELTRDATHHADATWTTHEQIHGDYLGGKVTARYHYEECEAGSRCPNACTIEATLTLAI